MSTLPAPVVHVQAMHVYLGEQSLDDAVRDALKVARDDQLITELGAELSQDRERVNWIRSEIEAALLLAGMHVEPQVTDEDLVAKVVAAVQAAKLHLQALERVSAVTSRAHEWKSPSELGLAVQAAIHPQLAGSNAIPTPPAGTPALFGPPSGGDR